ncbi:MAG TPA: hypothetical protein VGO55_11075 [Allosphingosinicella sp.]|jgi:hypothetical protein|nr:hypothetical protein [Allosphingosinicella sp.]
MDRADEAEAGPTPPIFILVHGTFAPDAAWTRADSPLATHLISRFPGANVRPFLWSGRNSHRARLAAGAELQQILVDTAAETPDAPLLLIAHSHGGNVALYALGQSPVSHRVFGLVCLATPFIACQARELSSLFSYLRWSLPLAAGFLAALLPLFLVIVVAPNDLILGSVGAALLTLYLSIAVAIRAQKGVDGRLRRWAERKQRAIIEELSPVPVSVPVVSASVTMDEARLWLRSAAAAGELPATIWRLAFPALRAIFILLALLLVPAAIYDFETGGHGGKDLIWLSVLFFLLPALSLIGALAWLRALLPWAIRGNRWVFGGEGIFHNFLVSISATITPSCARRFTHLDVNVSAGMGLRHSRLYSDENFIRNLGEIVGSIITRQSRQGEPDPETGTPSA